MKTVVNLLFLLFFATIYGFAQNNTSIITHGPYLQNVSDTAATIVFTTNKLVVPGVEIISKNGKSSLIRNSHDGLINIGNNIHKVRINNLLPGHEYRYRIFAQEYSEQPTYKITKGDTVVHNYKYSPGDTVVSQYFHFKTFSPDINPLYFTVFCDLHDRPEQLSEYLDSNDIEKQNCYFFNGDILSYIKNEAQIYSSFIDTSVNRFATEKPFFYVRGNHETRGHYARHLKKYLDFPNDKYYYASTIGDVRFIVIDGGEDKADTSRYYYGLADFDKYRLDQLQWLKKKLSSEDFKKAHFKIVITHMPIIKNKNNWYGMEFLAKYYGPVLQDAGIDLMISGHLHRNKWLSAEQSGFDYPVIISSNNHYVEAEVYESEILIRLKTKKGEVEELYSVKK